MHRDAAHSGQHDWILDSEIIAERSVQHRSCLLMWSIAEGPQLIAIHGYTLPSRLRSTEQLIAGVADFHRNQLIEEGFPGLRELNETDATISMNLIGGVGRKIAREFGLVKIAQHPVHN